MTALPPCLLCLLLFSPVLAFSTASSPPHESPNAGGIIQATCSMTSDYDFCVAALQSDPRSRKASDVKALSAAAVRIAARDARNASSYASRMTKNATGGGGGGGGVALRSALMRTCAEKYRYAVEALRSAAASLAAEDYDSAYVDVSAAEEYADACGRALRRQLGGLSYPEEMERREDDFKRLCATVQDIISQLG